MKAFNRFAKDIQFTVYLFQYNDVHFLDLSINVANLETSNYTKPTNTGQYTQYDSFTPWRLKMARIKSLYTHSKNLCSNEALFKKYLEHLRQLMSWNGLPRRVRSSILNRLSTNLSPKPYVKPVDDTKTICISLPCMGKQGESITDKLLRNLKRCFKTAVRFKASYNVQKVSSFCLTKDKIPSRQNKPMYNHLHNCNQYHEICNLLVIDDEQLTT